jgi:YVTN family beta-propeller protein
VLPAFTVPLPAGPGGRWEIDGTAPVAIAITPGGTTAYVADYTYNRVTPSDTATNTVLPAITVRESPEAIAITP